MSGKQTFTEKTGTLKAKGTARTEARDQRSAGTSAEAGSGRGKVEGEEGRRRGCGISDRRARGAGSVFVAEGTAGAETLEWGRPRRAWAPGAASLRQ